MKNSSQFYNEQLRIHKEALEVVKNQLNRSSLLRLFIFLALASGIYLALGHARIIVAIVVLGIALFLFLVTRHGRLQYKRDLIKKLMAINEIELKVLQRDFHELPSGEKFKKPNHFYSQDIDLFGKGSFYQYLNRTALESGAAYLAGLLTENDVNNIDRKQEAVKELSLGTVWRQQFSAMAQLVQTKVSAASVVQWLKSYQSFIPKGTKKGALGFSVISIILITLYIIGIISGWILFGWFLLGLTITGRFLKRINTLSSHISQIQSTFEQFYKLLDHIENHDSTSSLLTEKRTLISNETQKASVILKQFSRKLDALDQRNNMLIGVLTNGFLLRDLYIVYHIEAWIKQHHGSVENWFSVIAFFDGYNSLGNYAFNHKSQHFPELVDQGLIDAIQTGHPLLNPDDCVYNDFKIDNEQFFIITGANMAGKSTFLRTVALHIVMANIGLPVCAKTTKYSPIKLITSMRTTDSLTDDESYFYSELKRLKFIVDQIKTDRYFIILDEILKGTNSTDKAIGSRKFIDKLVASKSTGIIATHDLSLTAAADELSEVENYYFDAQIVDGELYFDYTLKEGICQNMNASFLLKKMEIVD